MPRPASTLHWGYVAPNGGYFGPGLVAVKELKSTEFKFLSLRVPVPELYVIGTQSNYIGPRLGPNYPVF